MKAACDCVTEFLAMVRQYLCHLADRDQTQVRTA